MTCCLVHGRTDLTRNILRKFALVMIATASILAISTPAAAQYGSGQLPAFQGATNKPKLSPYLDLLRNDNSVLSPYHAFVLPRREIAQRQAAQAIELRRLEFATTRRSAVSASTNPRFTTGRGGTFQSTLHFFPSSTSN